MITTSVTSIATSVTSSTSSSMAIAIAVRLGRRFPDLLLLLSRLIVAEVIKYASCVLVAVEHLRHPTEMPAAVHGEEEEHRTLALPFPPGRVQSLVAMFRAAPNLVFDTPMDIIFTIALYHKEARIFRAQIEIPGVVLVATSQL